MHKGFVIFRDPENTGIVGWKGNFITLKSYSGIDGFYIKAWERDDKIQLLQPEVISAEESIWQEWIAGVPNSKAPIVYAHDFEDFRSLIDFIKTGITMGDFEKIVAARCKFLSNSGISLLDMFRKICAENPEAFVSLLYHPEFGCWLGASPEHFLRIQDTKLETVALAGTLINNEDKWTEKEKKEQSAITGFINELLQKFGAKNISPGAVRTTTQGNLSHLSKSFAFELETVRIPEFVESLHPTPAVAGYPQSVAVNFLHRFENLDRKLFSGWLGYFDKGVFRSWVNLRCAKIYADQIQLFAGCGINSGSEAIREWEETEAKMEIIGKHF